MPLHFAYGVHFQSDFDLPELNTAPTLFNEAPGDDPVRIEVGEPISREYVAQLTRPGEPLQSSALWNDAEREAQLLFTQVGHFWIRGGKHIFLRPLEGTRPSTWRLPLLGAVMAALLEQRGAFVLHAGAGEFVNAAGEAVAAAFLGDKGQGKSTLNAALAGAGVPLLCDDVLALRFPDSSSRALPLALRGFAQLKLTPQSVREVLGREPEEFERVAPDVTEVDKRSVSVPLAQQARPLRDVFILSSRDEDEGEHPIEVRALAPQEALAQLVPHTFAARFGEAYLAPERRKRHFQACARTVGACRVWELSRRRDLTLLPHTIERIREVIGS